MARRTNIPSTEKQLPSIANRGYFSDYFLGYRLDAGLDDLYERWDAAERNGDLTARTRVRSLSTAFDKHRAEAANTAPDLADNDTRLALGTLHADDLAALTDLNDAVLTALGWTPTRDETVTLTSGEKVVHIPVAHRCDTATGLLLVALGTVFATDPATVVADKTAASGTLLHPVRLGDKPEGRTVLEAAQLIFTADDAPSYILVCSGGAVTLLDRDRWGEGVHLGANLDDAVARGDNRARGELAAIAALFSADAINPGDQAQSVLTGLVDRAANESAGVSKDLRHGIRRSVEILANAVVHDVRHRQKGAWQQIDPDDLTRQCLRYLYRIIVLLYAEARPELGILPVDDPDYQSGYSVSRLRDTALVELESDHARNATHLQRSLSVLFRLVNDGYEADATLDTDARALTFPGLNSALFAETSCPLLDRARLTDHTLQQMLAHLCFTREQRGRARQTVSYATLGINQLGAVYEGLMAYRGFLATEELYELDSDGDPDTGTWVIPSSRADEFPEDAFFVEKGPDGQPRRVRYNEGDFVFRLAGRDRQRSASYYSPEVLTEFTVRHTLDTYWDEHPDLTAAGILHLTVCEPALGSGAFLNEAINQLAARYLKTAQDESGETIDPDRYQLELQRTKAHFAVNQAYGVDLNPTAIELAEVSLWLNCMHPGLRAPRFGARLRHGNSLVGARRATYTVDQAKKRPWTSSAGSPSAPPTDQPPHAVPFGEATGIHHFLLPGEGWGVAADANELKGKGGKRPEPGLAENWAETVRAWRRSIQVPPTKAQLDRLAALGRRVEAAWATSAKDVTQHLRAHDRTIEVWGADPAALPAPGIASSSAFDNPEGPTTRLRLLMDAWCALWMWAPANGTALPTLDRWLDAAELILGQPDGADTGSLFTAHELDDGTLDSVEQFGRATVAEVLDRHPWLQQCQAIARTQEFFHWELEYGPLFGSGGVRLVVGNPPWVRPTWDEAATLSDMNPAFACLDLMPEAYDSARAETLADASAAATYVAERAAAAGFNQVLGSGTEYPALVSLKNNLYFNFMIAVWRILASDGTAGLLHQDSHLMDKVGSLRREAYLRLRKRFHFINELKLFEIHHQETFSMNVYGSRRADDDAGFLQMCNLYSPETARRSASHDGSGETPGLQYADGGWDLRPHARRMVAVDRKRLSTWAALLGKRDGRLEDAVVVNALTENDQRALERLALVDRTLDDVGMAWTRGFDQTKAARSRRSVVAEVSRPPELFEAILTSAHVLNSFPLAQDAYVSDRGTTLYRRISVGDRQAEPVPVTTYRWAPGHGPASENASWNGILASEHWRVAYRAGAGSVWGARTLQAALLPPGPSHTNTMGTIAFASGPRTTAYVCGLLSSLPYDYLVKVSGNSNINEPQIRGLPFVGGARADAILLRALLLNCVTSDFSHLWESCAASIEVQPSDEWLASRVSARWLDSTPLSKDADRWQAEVELDVLVALELGLDADDLVQMYRTQFGVLRRYETSSVFDANGHRVAADSEHHGGLQVAWEVEDRAAPRRRGEIRVGMWQRVAAHLAGEADVVLGPFATPFTRVDREKAIGEAFHRFARREGSP